MPEIQYPKNPNSDTAFVVQEDGTKNRALMTAPQDTSSLELPTNSNSCKGYVTIDGKKQRVILTADIGGGGDQHNLGYYATQSALEEAHPTAEAGDWAIVGSTDTVWVWDSDNTRWVDSDQKGQVTSVNGQTGDVTLTASDVGALPTSGGTITGRMVLAPTASLVPTHANQQLGSSILPFGIIYAGAFSEGEGAGRWFVPVGDGNTSGIFVGAAWSMPSPSADLDSVPILYLGTTNSNYTHGYIYECVTDDNTTYYWKQLNVQPSVKVNSTATLAVADWSSNTQTVTVSGVKADSVVFVSPAPASASDYASAGILCTAQAADSLTFTCTTTPTNAITVNVICF